jgi:hypothetical protein
VYHTVPRPSSTPIQATIVIVRQPAVSSPGRGWRAGAGGGRGNEGGGGDKAGAGGGGGGGGGDEYSIRTATLPAGTCG